MRLNWKYELTLFDLRRVVWQCHIDRIFFVFYWVDPLVVLLWCPVTWRLFSHPVLTRGGLEQVPLRVLPHPPLKVMWTVTRSSGDIQIHGLTFSPGGRRLGDGFSVLVGRGVKTPEIFERFLTTLRRSGRWKFEWCHFYSQRTLYEITSIRRTVDVYRVSVSGLRVVGVWQSPLFLNKFLKCRLLITCLRG